MTESIADIIREMRGWQHHEVLGNWPDRLEAATKPPEQVVCNNCKHYDRARQYCPRIDSAICRGVAQALKANGCAMWEAR